MWRSWDAWADLSISSLMSSITFSGMLEMFLRLKSRVTPRPSEETLPFLRCSTALVLARAALRECLARAMTAASVRGTDILGMLGG